MSEAVQCDQCKTVARPGRWGWVQASGSVEPVISERMKEVDLCSRRCVLTHFAGPCPADPGADFHDYGGSINDDCLGEAVCARCGHGRPSLRGAVR